MTVKQFFKSTAFKCIAALLCVLLISGIFLTIMNSLLAVSDQERFERAINKIYGKNVKTETVALAGYDNGGASIQEAYKIKDDGNYLVKSTGRGGFDSGTVTCWVVVKVSGGAVSGIEKVIVDSNERQTQMAEIKTSYLNTFTTEFPESGYFYTSDGYLVSGSTRTSNAICNAVNGAVDFVNAIFGNVASDPYENFLYTDNIDNRNTSHELNEDGSVTFHIRTNGFGNAAEFNVDITVGADGKITAYVITTNGSTSGYDASMLPAITDGTLFVGKGIDEIKTIVNEGIEYPGDNAGTAISSGASQSNYLCLSAAAFATANYEACISADGGEDNEEGGDENE